MCKLSHIKGLKCGVTFQGILKDYYLLNCLLNGCILLNSCVEEIYICLSLGQMIEDLRQPQHY